LNIVPFTVPITAFPAAPVTGVVDVTDPVAAPLMKKYAVLLVDPRAHENATWVHVLDGTLLVN
jgi:hypothetical protein